jgi:hypothetical protein
MRISQKCVLLKHTKYAETILNDKNSSKTIQMFWKKRLIIFLSDPRKVRLIYIYTEGFQTGTQM